MNIGCSKHPRTSSLVRKQFRRGPRMMIRGSVVTPAGIVTDGVVDVTGDTIAEVRAATPDDDAAGARTGAWILPGFVDIHVHGGGGFTFTTGEADQARGVADFH